MYILLYSTYEQYFCQYRYIEAKQYSSVHRLTVLNSKVDVIVRVQFTRTLQAILYQYQ